MTTTARFAGCVRPKYLPDRRAAGSDVVVVADGLILSPSQTNPKSNKPMKRIELSKSIRTLVAALVAASLSAPSAFAASQTWSNAPTDATWSNAVNWVAGAVPGALNQTGNQSVGADIATFNSPLAGGIGGAGNPIVPDDATVANARARTIGGITFSGTAGAYVFDSPSLPVLPATGIPGAGMLYVCHPQNIVMEAAVANKQEFLLPVEIRLPSSTNGRFGITNNATSSEATLFFEAITNSSASSRPLQLYLDGSNTGTNTIAVLGERSSGALQVIKSGSGKWILAGANQWSQQTDLGFVAGATVNGGTLVVRDAGAFGALNGNNVVIQSGGVLQIDNASLNTIALGLRNAGTIRMNGSVTLNGVLVGNAPGTSATLATTSASDVLTVGAVSPVAGGAADSVLHVTGPGTTLFNYPNTYLGSWSFDAGTNQLSGSLGTGPSAHIAAGAILDTSLLGTYALTTAALSANGTGTTVGGNASAINAGTGGTFDLASKAINLTFTPTSTSGDITHPALYVVDGSLSLNANTFTVNNASGSPLGAGTYRLAQQAVGSVTDAGGHAVIVGGAGLVPFGVASIQISGGNVDMVVVVYIPKDLSWKGGNLDATWNINSTANFDDGVGFSVFNNTDDVTFGPLGSTYPTVTLVGTLAPSSVVVDTSANDYTFSSGPGQIGGTTALTKINAGTLTLATANTYQGGTTVSNGTLRVGVENAIPSAGSGNVAVEGSGIIDLNGYNNSINGLNGNGTVDEQSAATSTLTVGNNNASSTFSGLLTDSVGTLNLTKTGNGTLTLQGAHTYSGATTISGGSVAVSNPNVFGSGNSPVALTAGSIVTTTSLNLSNLTGSVGTSIANGAGAGANTITHVGVGSFTGIISDGVSGSISVYVPSGTLQLNAVNTYSGGTVVASGATFAVGVINPGGSGTAGTGGITASNGAVVALPTALGTAATPGNNITNVDANGTITLSSASQGNGFNGQFIGGVNSTNIFVGPGSVGGNMSFAGFPGTVIISNNASTRFWQGTGVDGGGDDTTFEVWGNVFNRDARTPGLGHCSAMVASATPATPARAPGPPSSSGPRGFPPPSPASSRAATPL
jgi:fibronectin-binding autotransporter adhesin